MRGLWLAPPICPPPIFPHSTISPLPPSPHRPAAPPRASTRTAGRSTHREPHLDRRGLGHRSAGHRGRCSPGRSWPLVVGTFRARSGTRRGGTLGTRALLITRLWRARGTRESVGTLPAYTTGEADGRRCRRRCNLMRCVVDSASAGRRRAASAGRDARQDAHTRRFAFWLRGSPSGFEAPSRHRRRCPTLFTVASLVVRHRQ